MRARLGYAVWPTATGHRVTYLPPALKHPSYSDNRAGYKSYIYNVSKAAPTNHLSKDGLVPSLVSCYCVDYEDICFVVLAAVGR